MTSCTVMRLAVLLALAACSNEPSFVRGMAALQDEAPPAAAPAPAARPAPMANPARGSAAPLTEQLAIPTKPAKAKSHGKRAHGGTSSSSSSSSPAPAPEHHEDLPAHGRANGIECTWDSDCASGHCSFERCDSGSSDKKFGNGVACTWDSDCASGHCSFSKCDSGDSGNKKLGTGVACTWDSDCASGHCSFEKCSDD